MVCYIHKQTYAGETRPLERLVIPDVVIAERKCARKRKKPLGLQMVRGFLCPRKNRIFVYLKGM